LGTKRTNKKYDEKGSPEWNYREIRDFMKEDKLQKKGAGRPKRKRKKGGYESRGLSGQKDTVILSASTVPQMRLGIRTQREGKLSGNKEEDQSGFEKVKGRGCRNAVALRKEFEWSGR
jgi:hypothetical protein